MELHALHGKLAVANTHDFAVLGFGRDLQAGGQGRATNGQRVIAGRDEGARQSPKHAHSRMLDRRGFPVNNLSRLADLAAERLADRLVSQAHAQDRNLARKIANHTQRYARLAGRAGSRRDDDALRPHRLDVSSRDLVVASHFDFGTQFPQILHQIPGERIVVVDHQHHDPSRPSMPPIAISAARSTARALARVSCHSLSGTESATIPAPACTCIWPPFTTAVRIAMAKSMSPLNPR